jgi:hypothetical protein
MSEEAWEGRKESQQADQQQPPPPESQQPEFVIHVKAQKTPAGRALRPAHPAPQALAEGRAEGARPALHEVRGGHRGGRGARGPEERGGAPMSSSGVEK